MTGEALGETRRLSRRGVVRGAVWAVPVIVGTSAAPAMAASTCTSSSALPTLTFGAPNGTKSTGVTNGNGSLGAGNGWSFSANGSGYSTTNTNDVGFVTGTGLPYSGRNCFAANAEPTSLPRTLTLTQTGQAALVGSCGYTLKFGAVVYVSSAPDPTFTVLAGSTVIASYTTSGQATTSGYVDRGIQTFTVPAGTTGTISMQMSFPGSGTNSASFDDIVIYSPSITSP